MQRIWTIAANSFVETVRQPIYFILLLVTFGILAMNIPLAGYTMETDIQESDNRMMVDLGLSTLVMSGLFIAAFAASGVMAREIEERTVLTVVSKPVNRPSIVLGKFLGVLAASTVAYYLGTLVFLMTVRHGTMPTASDKPDMVVLVFGLSGLGLSLLGAMFCNYFFGWQFSGTAVAFMLVLLTAAMGLIGLLGKDWTVIPFGRGIAPQILVVVLLLWLAVMLIAALALAASTRLGSSPRWASAWGCSSCRWSATTCCCRTWARTWWPGWPTGCCPTCCTCPSRTP